MTRRDWISWRVSNRRHRSDGGPSKTTHVPCKKNVLELVEKPMSQLYKELNLEAIHDGMNSEGKVADKGPSEPNEPHDQSDKLSSNKFEKDSEYEGLQQRKETPISHFKNEACEIRLAVSHMDVEFFLIHILLLTCFQRGLLSWWELCLHEDDSYKAIWSCRNMAHVTYKAFDEYWHKH